MATDDISRSGYYPQKRYSGVRMQQGRVLTDDDFNQQEVINHEDKRLMRKDVIGTAGSPDRGFAISNADDTGGIDFQINAGVFYLGGVRVELHQQQTFRLQKDWLQNPDISPPVGERQDMAYLEVWQQNVSAVEDEELFETALGGPDTTTRRRTMCRVRLAENVGSGYCAEAWATVKAHIEASVGGQFRENHALSSDADLTIGYENNGDGEDLCSPSAIAGYLGAENQSIRVQLTDSSHFTWGFDNGAPLYRVNLEDAGSTRNTIKLLTEPKDQAHWPKAGQIVEIIPWSAVLENGEKLAEELEPGHFSTLTGSYDPDTNMITLATALPDPYGNEWESRSDVADLRKTRFGTEDLDNIHGYFFMRVWDRGADQLSDPQIQITNTPLVLGNTGLNVTFTGTHRLPGDYWIISARPHTPDQVYPWQLEVSRGSEGYRRFYAPLGIIHWNEPDTGDHIIYDCRRTFRPLTDQNGCCIFTVGDGVKSRGDFNSIEEAVRHLPIEGGRICVLPGVHHANIKIGHRQNIHFTGCKKQSIVHPKIQSPDDPVFHLIACQNIRIDDLTLVTHNGEAIMVTDSNHYKNTSTGIHIETNHILALTHAIFVQVDNQRSGKNDIRIINNEIAMLDKINGGVAIYTQADDVLIDNNRIVVIPAPDAESSDGDQDPDAPPWIIWNPCEDGSSYYQQYTFMINLVMRVFGFMQKVWFEQQNQHQYIARGGIQIGGGSELVSIKNNQIVGGLGNGITLGSLPDAISQGHEQHIFLKDITEQERKILLEELEAYLYDIRIENNTITNMGLSGIGVPAFMHSEKIGVMLSVEEVLIRENVITQCAHQLPDRDSAMAMESGFGGIVLAAAENIIISQNRIEDNGNFEVMPVCGVLLLYGENVDISGNRIHHNGPADEEDLDFEKGLRGGIVVAMSFKQLQRADGIPAVKVHNNIVTQPLGQALMIIALGPVSVVGNQFTSQGVDLKANSYSIFAGAIFILNLGISQDLMATMLLSSFKYIAANNLYMEQTTTLAKGGNITSAAQGLTGLLKYLYLPSGNVLFTSNQTTLDLQSPLIDFAFSAQAIASLDDIGYNNNQSDCRSFIDILFTDVALLGTTIRSNNNRFQEGITVTISSLFSFGMMNTAVTNQSTHCLFTFGSKQFLVNKDNSALLPIGCNDQIDIIGQHIAAPQTDLQQTIVNIR
jgi:hypothetical protein